MRGRRAYFRTLGKERETWRLDEASRESKHLVAQFFAETIAGHGSEPGLAVRAHATLR